MKFRMLDNPRHVDRWEYLCLVCDNRFFFRSGDIVCPRCNNTDYEEVVPMYVGDDPRAEELVLRADFGEGD
jgi:hypothetical protein